MSNKKLAVVLAILIPAVTVFIVFFVLRKPDNNNPSKNAATSNLSGSRSDVNSQPSSGPSNYLSFDSSKFGEDLASGKKVSLFFWANWCPTCRAQEPINVKTLESISDPDVVVYKVNILDSETTEEGEALASKYGVTYQHTFVALDGTGEKIDLYNGQFDQSDLTTFVTQPRS